MCEITSEDCKDEYDEGEDLLLAEPGPEWSVDGVIVILLLDLTPPLVTHTSQPLAGDWEK